MIQNKNMDYIDLSFLKIAISGGDTLPTNMKNEIDEFLKNHGANIQIRPGYGLTESLSGACMVPKEGYKNESVGIPHPGFNIKIVKEGHPKHYWRSWRNMYFSSRSYVKIFKRPRRNI